MRRPSFRLDYSQLQRPRTHTHTLCLDLEEHTDTYTLYTFSCKVPKVSKAGAQILGLQALSMLRNLLSFKL